MNPYYQNAKFLVSAPSCAQAPADSGVEVAFAGRSNAGKSSAINALCHQKALARTSKTPGRTRLLNFFILDEERRLVDLPCYGYAKVGDAMKRDWQLMMTDYLERRQSLRGLILLMDSRHPLKEFDRQMLEWSAHAGLPVHILLTKADKLKKGPASAVLHQVRREISKLPNITAQLFSALKHQGIDEVHEMLDRWLMLETAKKNPGE